jgi:hypothetical protein
MTRGSVDSVVEGWFGHIPCVDQEQEFVVKMKHLDRVGDHITHRRTCHRVDSRDLTWLV